MSSSLEKLKALTSKLEEKLEQKKQSNVQRTVAQEEKVEKPAEKTLETSVEKPVEKSVEPVVTVHSTPMQKPAQKLVKEVGSDNVRQENIDRVKILYDKLKIYEKSPDFDNIFLYKAMNLSGIGLKEEDFGQVREGKYIQVIAITYEPDKNGKKRAKNISLGYFGKAETLEPKLKNDIIEFVLRWRYEKAFQNVEHYKDLINKIDVSSDTLF